MHQFRLGFSYGNVYLRLCTFVIYDGGDALCDSLEAVRDCPLQSGSIWQLSPVPSSSILRGTETTPLAAIRAYAH